MVMLLDSHPSVLTQAPGKRTLPFPTSPSLFTVPTPVRPRRRVSGASVVNISLAEVEGIGLSKISVFMSSIVVTYRVLVCHTSVGWCIGIWHQGHASVCRRPRRVSHSRMKGS